MLASLTYLAGCGLVEPPPNIQPQAANAISLAPQDWYVYYSDGMPPHPSADGEAAWSFEFPSAATGGHVSYVQTPFNTTTTTTLHNVVVTFKVDSNSPQYSVVDPTDISPATVHVFFEQKNDDLSSANGRWWAGASIYNLGSEDNSTLTYSIPFTPDQWTNVFGKSASANFYESLGNVGWIGVTFGGQYFWGHGVTLASGNSKFTLIDFHVN
jgi:hypothetical protein